METTSRISAEEYNKMRQNNEIRRIIQDSNLQAYEKLSQEDRETIDKADELLSRWTPDDSHFELNKHRQSLNKSVYLRMDIYGLKKEEKDKLEELGIYKDLKEAIKKWNGYQLTFQIKETLL